MDGRVLFVDAVRDQQQQKVCLTASQILRPALIVIIHADDQRRLQLFLRSIPAAVEERQLRRFRSRGNHSSHGFRKLSRIGSALPDMHRVQGAEDDEHCQCNTETTAYIRRSPSCITI